MKDELFELSCVYYCTYTQVYLEPLKRSQAAGIADPSLVKDIFYQIPEIHNLHERFLYRLRDRVEHWDVNQKIGDIFVNTVSQEGTCLK